MDKYFQYIEHRNPILPRTFHTYIKALAFQQPFLELHKKSDERLKIFSYDIQVMVSIFYLHLEVNDFFLQMFKEPGPGNAIHLRMIELKGRFKHTGN